MPPFRKPTSLSAPCPEGLQNEFFREALVQLAVKNAAKPAMSAKQPLKEAAPAAKGAKFSFGARRYTSKGPRRLFVPQKCLISPAFEPDFEPPKGLLRVVSSCA